ncbi:glycosyltransferase WecB/TagA/CpsF family protein [Anopheles sinensis]|uniref:Glycosyltransferase WecB/TagA/CpsF family protein n=1 Tax=Anopheles sinensis TaxID=74873 RepID=A0A084VEU2_ANOSI|nr:glycosyltransferase WecB/TagA/CpsF family protein [Anopheles sinensis]
MLIIARWRVRGNGTEPDRSSSDVGYPFTRLKDKHRWTLAGSGVEGGEYSRRSRNLSKSIWRDRWR